MKSNKKSKLILSTLMAILIISSCTLIINSAAFKQEDNYEPNNYYTTAYDLSLDEGIYLSGILGVGYCNDDDWYEIYVDPGEQRLYVELLFSHASGDLDLIVFDEVLGWLEVSDSITDNEIIDVLVPSPGLYYILVYYDDTPGNLYDLMWDDLPSEPPLDDNYEENDDPGSAYYLSPFEGIPLSVIDGPGYCYDDDWYEIYVDPDELRLYVELLFLHAAGDLDIEVWDFSYNWVAGSYSMDDNEFIDVIIPFPGTYYILIYFFDFPGNQYDLMWDDLPSEPPIDDNYEENDDYTSAFDLSEFEDTWLSTIAGLGIQADYDWYEIYVEPGYEYLQVILTFSHAAGDMNIDVYDASLNYIAQGYSTTDNEYANVIVPSFGTYYLLIYGENAGNEYDLWWDDTLVPPDDNYEENDDPGSAYDLSGDENTWLSTIDGLGIQLDYDLYEIYVDPGDLRLLVDLTFTHADGNIEIGVGDSGLNIITYSMSTTDNEYIDYVVPSSGTYYLIIIGENRGNPYDLWWDDLSSSDDNYEENDAYTTAYDLSTHKNVWLSTVNGTGVQFDEDWYEITIDPGYEQLIVDLTFAHTADNLDLGIYDSTGTLVTERTSSTDDEHIDCVLPSSGTYYIIVNGTDIGNEYDLRWNSIIPDDNYEENDDLDSAYDLSGDKDTLLSTIDGLGVQLDDDWYEISIAPGYENVTIVLSFTHSAGNIQLALYNSTGNLITSSTSTTDNEYINYIVSSSGTYYIRVYGDDAGNSYNLMWISIEYIPPGDGPPAIPGYDLLFLFGVIIAISILTIRKLLKSKPKFQEKF